MPSRRNNAHRSDRINEEIVRELTDILRTVKDPRIAASFVSITRADTTPDLKYSKIYYSLLAGSRLSEEQVVENEKEVLRGLKSAMGYIRRELAMRLNLRMTPELQFVRDTSIEHGAKIARILKTLDIKLDDPDDPNPSENGGQGSQL